MAVPYIWGDLKLCVINYLPLNCFRGCHFRHVPFEAWIFRLAIERWSQRLWRWVDSDQQNHQRSIPKWWNNNIWFYQRMRGISAPKLVTQSNNCIFASSDGTWPSKIENWKTKRGIDSKHNQCYSEYRFAFSNMTNPLTTFRVGWNKKQSTCRTHCWNRVFIRSFTPAMVKTFFFVKRDNHPLMSEDYI